MTPQHQPGTAVLDRADSPGLPRLADGAELAGEFVGAGYREPPLLVYRADGQVVRLPELLYRTIRALDDCHRLGDPAASRRSFTDRRQVLSAVAGMLGEQTGREYTAGHVEFLLDKKLAPLGVTTFSDGSPPEVVKPQPFLSLTCKATMLSERATWFLAGLFTWLFRTPVLVCTVAAILAAESWMFAAAPLAAAMKQTIQSPGAILLVVLLAIASTGFHEIGHGAACRYGGVRPGVTGCGFYLAWPVFFTDITNSYRLGRGGRLRTDLGGVYFNGIFILGLTALYLATGTPLLLVAVLSTSLEAVQQLLPTLRFDGYYIIADLVGIPDLFKYIGPILRRVLFRKPDDGRLAALKRWPQVIITIWVLLVVPVLFGQLALLAYNFPQIVASDWEGIRSLAASSMAGPDPVLGVVSATVRILLLLFPLVGIVLIGFRLLRGLARFAMRRVRVARAASAATTVMPASVQSLLDSPERPRDSPGRPRAADVPGPRHSTRRTGLVVPMLGAVAVLGVCMVVAWGLAPSLQQGTAADTQPDKIVGVPVTPGASSLLPSSGAEPRARQWRLGAGGPHQPSPAATWPAVSGYRGSGSPSAGGDPPGGSGQSRPSPAGNSSTASSSYPGASVPGGFAPGTPASGGSAPSRSSGGLSAGQPRASSGQASSHQAPSGPPAATPSSAQSPSTPSSSARWTPAPSQGQQGQSRQGQAPSDHAQPSQTGQRPLQSPAGSPAGQPSSAGPSAGQPPSARAQSASGSPSASPAQPPAGPSVPGYPAAQPQPVPSPSASSGCATQVNLVLLELNGLCP